MKYQIPPGVFDILPENEKEIWKSSYLWSYVENKIREIAVCYGLKEIRTPLFERTELFQRSVGGTSDIVTKEMYTFEDKGGRSLSLRPEGTAPVIRAFIENNLQEKPSCHRLFYISSMFRYERAQAGRYRQHHQFGVELIGDDSPEQDAEVIDLLYSFYQKLGLEHLTLYINSIGDDLARTQYKEALKKYLYPFLAELSSDSQRRFETNPLRILDSKEEIDQEILKNAPSILDFLSHDCQKHFSSLCKNLDLIGIPYVIEPKLVRGLDYYNNTVFEIVAGELGAQNSIGAGGRYNGLIRSLGGPDLPAIGFGTGIERIIQTICLQNKIPSFQKGPLLYLIPMGEEAEDICFLLQKKLREENISVEMEFKKRKLTKSLQYADHIQAKYVAVIGDQEIQTKKVLLKEMETKTEIEYPIADLGKILEWERNGQDLAKAWEKISQPFSTTSEVKYFLNKTNQKILQAKEMTENFHQAIKKIDELCEEIQKNIQDKE